MNCLSLELKRFLGEVDFSYTLYNSFDTTLAFFFTKAGTNTSSLQPYQTDNRSSEEQERINKIDMQGPACVETYFYLFIIIPRTKICLIME